MEDSGGSRSFKGIQFYYIPSTARVGIRVIRGIIFEHELWEFELDMFLQYLWTIFSKLYGHIR